MITSSTAFYFQMHTPNFVASKLSIRVIFPGARLVRELLFIDLFIVVALLGAEEGGGTCILNRIFMRLFRLCQISAGVFLAGTITMCDFFSFYFRFRLYLN